MGPRNSSNQAVLDSAVRHEAQWGGSTGSTSVTPCQCDVQDICRYTDGAKAKQTATHLMLTHISYTLCSASAKHNALVVLLNMTDTI